MTITRAYKSLHAQLLINAKAAAKKQAAQDLKKNIALLTYQRVNALRNFESDKILDIDTKLRKLKSQAEDPDVVVDTQLIEGLKVKSDSSRHVEHINNVADFLKFQRTYQELIERYNPGLTMTQEDNIRKTAHRVGFELPQKN